MGTVTGFFSPFYTYIPPNPTCYFRSFLDWDWGMTWRVYKADLFSHGALSWVLQRLLLLVILSAGFLTILSTMILNLSELPQPHSASPLGGPIGQALRWPVIMHCIWSSGSTPDSSSPVRTFKTQSNHNTVSILLTLLSGDW